MIGARLRGVERRARGRRLGLLVLPAAREGLDERDDGESLLVRELMPRGHCGPPDAARDRAVEIAVGRQGSRRCRAELEDPEREVSGAWGEEGRGRTIAVSALSATAAARGLIGLAPERQQILAAWDVD